ncbi:hypothetical protein [Actinoplanes awajinensis]|uniref:Uncharacterized protein n=1 Tax=Actinoplanes awajinensis subsp. mycoplanecinus TaxID=135947 RepID=A0A101JL68_9ACTN|nr:hypothetical protein [Actinoplanes awajinensis]KUL28919.1 hypothetical protein ADL15_30195 [Actinoplanes awajinensis subsp. mycoplanecinus]
MVDGDSEPPSRGGVPGWLRRRRHPRLSGTLRVRGPLGHDVTIPLRSRAAVLTRNGSGLPGHGDVWAVHTDPQATAVSLMISYGRTDDPADRQTGLCPPGATITLAGTRFTWNRPATGETPVPPAAAIPRPRTGNGAPAAGHEPGANRNTRAPFPRAGNARPAPVGLRRRVRAMVREITGR